MCFLPSLSWADLAWPGDVFAMHSTEVTDCVSGSLLLDTLFYKGPAGPHYLLEKNI